MCFPGVSAVVLFVACVIAPQTQFTAETKPIAAGLREKIETKRAELEAVIAVLRQKKVPTDLIADVAIYAKAAEWIVRHGEFYTEKDADFTLSALDRGSARARALADGKAGWTQQTGRLSRGFVSRVDGSVQPYGVVLPPKYDEDPDRPWRLDVELHGRGATLHEVSFLQAHDSNQPVPAEQDFIQLDVFGRTNNAYRWAGETDVFEAIESVKRRYRVDERRMVLRGFSMGGAGSWHLGLHHPDKWCSVGPGAGFSDTKLYQKITAPLPPWQEATLHIYDAIDYVPNALHVPIVCYGGEDDPQLAASRRVRDAVEKLGVHFVPDGLNDTATEIPFLFLVGPKTGHQFHPESRKRAMAFHAEHARAGVPYLRDQLRFVTYTLKYPGAFGYTIREMQRHYTPATITVARGSDGVVDIKATNATVLEVNRGVAPQIRVGSELIDTESAADGLLPTLIFRRRGDRWEVMNYLDSVNELRTPTVQGAPARAKKSDPDWFWTTKRPGLQGPIDDAFTGPFLCVRGTGEPWSSTVAAWSNWSLDRFAREWDKYLRGKLPLKNDTDVTPEDIRDHHLVLFGDPGSNRWIREALPRLPLDWTREAIALGGRTFDSRDHAAVLIYPNPLNPRRYVVLNSGHTFHAAEFRASNAQLYPRLGDFAVLQCSSLPDGGYAERPVRAGVFDEQWRVTPE